MGLIFRDPLDIKANVICILRDRYGMIVSKYESHNIVVNLGRLQARNMLGCSSYPTGNPVPAITLEEYAIERNEVKVGNYKIRYIGVGVGGALQSQAYPGIGSKTERVTVNGLERPVLFDYKAAGYTFTGMAEKGYTGDPPKRLWLAQVLPQQNTTEYFPDNYKIRFKKIFNYKEISMVNQIGEYGTQVPVTEVGLFTSEADPYRAPADADPYIVKDMNGDEMESITGFGGDVPGLFAYNVTVPLIKTPLVTLEIIWEIRT